MIPWRRVMTVRAVVLRLWVCGRLECIVNTYIVYVFLSRKPHTRADGRTRRAAEPSVDRTVPTWVRVTV